MPAIQRLLERLGFVKLQRYGLVKTPDGRILSMRPAVLDDGTGGRVVGWEDGDLAMAELAPWPSDAPRLAQPVPRAPLPPAPPVTPPLAAPARRALPGMVASPASLQPVVPQTSLPAQAEVAAEPAVDEDEWEWTIALARARAAAEEVEVARVTYASSASSGKTRPMQAAALAVKDPAASGEWPSTEPIGGAIDYEDPSRVGTRPSMPIPRAPAPPASVPRAAPVTVIPVPSLPSLQTTNGASRLEPVVSSVPPASLHRFPKGTKTVGSKTDAYPQVAAPPAMSDDTDPNVSVGDRTTPGIAMPRALPSIKRG